MQVRLSDVIIPEVFGSYVDMDSPERTAFVESGVVTRNAMLDTFANGPSQTVTLPYWNDLDASVEPNYSNDVYTDVAEPGKIDMGEQLARTAYLNEGWSSMDLTAEILGQDPMQKIASKVNRYWDRQLQKRVIATALGIYNDNVASDGGDMVVDVSSSTPGTITDANRFTAAAFIDAGFTLGDRYEGLAGIVVHSMVMRQMVKLDLIEMLPDSEGKPTIASYLGKRVVVDDGMPTIGTGVDRKYISILFGAGAMGWGAGTPHTPEEVERAPARGNGGGVEELWTRRTWLIHPAGYKFLSTTVTGPGISPTWADLALAANWERVVDRRHVPMSFLLTNA